MKHEKLTRYQAMSNLARAIQDAMEAGLYGIEIIDYVTNYILLSFKDK